MEKRVELGNQDEKIIFFVDVIYSIVYSYNFILALSIEISSVNNPYLPGMDLLETNPTCERGSLVHTPSRTPSDTSDSALGNGLAPGNIIPIQ